MKKTDDQIRSEAFYAHPLSQHVSIQYAPDYQGRWMNPELYKMVLDEEYARLHTLWRMEKHGNEAIIHIKGQHRLYPDGTPGPELKLRLQKALKVGADLKDRGLKVTYVTSGAVHAGCGTVALADSAAKWLIDHGVDPDSIVRHVELKNGNSEDYLVANMMDANEAISELHVVCSNNQQIRTMLCFAERGWIPNLHPVAYLGLDPNSFKGEVGVMVLDALRPHHGNIAELRGRGFGIAPFFEGADALRASEKAARDRHESELQTFIIGA